MEVRTQYRIGEIDIHGINRVFGQLADRLDELEGRRGTPTFKADIDAGGNRLTNVADATEATDAVTKGQAHEVAYPVGVLFFTTLDTSPEEQLGYGTWVRYGAGRVILSRDPEDAMFDITGNTGGATSATFPAHTHPLSTPIDTNMSTDPDESALWTSQVTDGAGGAATIDTMPPYVVVNVWERTG